MRRVGRSVLRSVARAVRVDGRTQEHGRRTVPSSGVPLASSRSTHGQAGSTWAGRRAVGRRSIGRVGGRPWRHVMRRDVMTCAVCAGGAGGRTDAGGRTAHCPFLARAACLESIHAPSRTAPNDTYGEVRSEGHRHEQNCRITGQRTRSKRRPVEPFPSTANGPVEPPLASSRSTPPRPRHFQPSRQRRDSMPGRVSWARRVSSCSAAKV